MKNLMDTILKIGTVFVAVMIVWLFSGEAAAADTSGDWRPVYDLVLRYINFLILVFLIVKYARKPLVNFFREKSQDIKKEIQDIETAKAQAREQVKLMQEAYEQNKEKLDQMKERIIAQGRARQQSIIDDARLESRMLLENTQRKIDNRILRAKNRLRVEMVDMAVDMAMKQLPQEITDQDNQRITDHYLQSTRLLQKTS